MGIRAPNRGVASDSQWAADVSECAEHEGPIAPLAHAADILRNLAPSAIRPLHAATRPSPNPGRASLQSLRDGIHPILS
jgi:hypothetical protein